LQEGKAEQLKSILTAKLIGYFGTDKIDEMNPFKLAKEANKHGYTLEDFLKYVRKVQVQYTAFEYQKDIAQIYAFATTAEIFGAVSQLTPEKIESEGAIFKGGFLIQEKLTSWDALDEGAAHIQPNDTAKKENYKDVVPF
jgi:hypothetical protein